MIHSSELALTLPGKGHKRCHLIKRIYPHASIHQLRGNFHLPQIKTTYSKTQLPLSLGHSLHGEVMIKALCPRLTNLTTSKQVLKRDRIVWGEKGCQGGSINIFQFEQRLKPQHNTTRDQQSKATIKGQPSLGWSDVMTDAEAKT